MKPTYLNYLKKHWKVTLILTLAHATIIPAFILIKTSEHLWDDIGEDGEQFVETKTMNGIYKYDDENEKFVPVTYKTGNPNYMYLNLTMVFGAMVTWILIAITLPFIL